MTLPAEEPTDIPVTVGTPSFQDLSDSEKLEFLCSAVNVMQTQVAWITQQVYGLLSAVSANPMLRKVMGK